MAPVEQPKAKRRWTPNRSREGREESSNEDYGEEILPTIDLDALATLSRDDQEKFKEMRRRDRKNVIARWRREGRPLPETSASSSSGSSKPIARKSSAPQLPELQMDVEPKGTFSSASDNARQPTRFHGIGPIPPESGLASHAPSASERMHGQTVTSVHNVLRSTGQLNAHSEYGFHLTEVPV